MVSKTRLNLRPISALFDNNETDIISIRTATYFDYSPCDQTHSKLFCENAGLSKDLVIIIGHDSKVYKAKFGYYSYRLRGDKVTFNRVINSNMPWNMTSTGGVSRNYFWHIPDHGFLYGLSFSSYGNKDILYGVMSNYSNVHDIVYRRITDGKPENNWETLKSNPQKLMGLFAHRDSIFVLDGSENIFHVLKTSNNALTWIKRISAKELFCCYNNCTDFDTQVIAPSIPGLTGNDATTTPINSYNNRTKESATTKKSTYDQIVSNSVTDHLINSTTVTVETIITLSPSGNFLYIWLLFFLVAILLVAIFAAVIYYLLNKKRSAKHKKGMRFNSEDDSVDSTSR